jgi:hypothetical protein
MTEEIGGAGRVPEPEAHPAVPAPVRDTTTAPESMMMLGAGLILGGWLLFGIVLDDYFTDWTVLLLAVLVLLMARSSGGFYENIALRSTLLKVAGYAIGILAVFELIFDIRFAGGELDSFVEILGALALFGGSALVFMGARSIVD